MAWVRLDDHFDEHDKFVAAGYDAGWMFIRSLANCNRRESDGHIPTAQLARIGSDFGPRKRQQLAARLVSVGMWHEPGHDCDRCPDPGEGWQVHDYPDYQLSRASKENERSEARERMRRARKANTDRSSEDVRTEQGENDPRSSVNPGPGPVPEVPKEPQSGASRGKPRSDRATRIPDGWTPDPEAQLQREAEQARVDLHRELERFRDYWHAQPGAKGRKVSWQATWRNWLRRAIDDRPKPNGTPRPPPRSQQVSDHGDASQTGSFTP